MYKYLFGLIAILGVALWFSVSSVMKQKDRADRMTEQYQMIEKDSKQLELTFNELNDRQSSRIKELSDSLDIKPKHVTEYVNVYITDTIRDTIYTDVVKLDSNTYEFAKDTACFRIKGLVGITPKDPVVIITELDYINDIEYIVYLNRKEWKVWFIKSKFLGEKYVDLEVIQTCGSVKVEDVQLIKK